MMVKKSSMQKPIEEAKSSGQGAGEKKSKTTKFRAKKGTSKTYVGFFSITKKFQTQIDRVVSAINENTQVSLARNSIEQTKVNVLKELAENLKLKQITKD